MYIEARTDKSMEEAGNALEEAGRKRKFAIASVPNFCCELVGNKALFDRELLIYEVCHEYTCRKILNTNVRISTLLPFKICIFREGEETVISTVEPVVSLRIFKEPTLGNLFEELTEVIAEIIEEAARNGLNR